MSEDFWDFPKNMTPSFRGIIQGPVLSVQVLSRELMALVVPEYPYIVVSIADPGQREIAPGKSGYVDVPRHPGCKGVLEVDFHDIEFDGNPYRYKSITDEDAREIAAFVLESQERGEWPLLIVHCEAGVCRSSAVAAALYKFLNNKSDAFFWDENKGGYLPNKLVYQRMMDAFGEWTSEKGSVGAD